MATENKLYLKNIHLKKRYEELLFQSSRQYTRKNKVHVILWITIFFIAFIGAYIQARMDGRNATVAYLQNVMIYSFFLTLGRSVIKYFEMKYVERKEKEDAESKNSDL